MAAPVPATALEPVVVRDLSLEPGRAVLLGTPLSFALLALVVVPHRWLHHEDALKALFGALGGWWFGPALIAGIVVHELLHAATWALAGGLRASELELGVRWRALMPYAHPRRPLTVAAYALGAALPGVLLGLVPALAGLAAGRGAWSGWGAIFLAAASGDLIVLVMLRGLPLAGLVRDHPTRVGCEHVRAPEVAW